MPEYKRDDIQSVIHEVLTEFEEENSIGFDFDQGEKMRLFGGDGPLDSMGLVSLIVDVEEAVQDRFGLSIALATEKAMSRRTSPFARFDMFIDFVEEVIKEANNV